MSGYAIWIGTPKGKNELYRLYLRGPEIRISGYWKGPGDEILPDAINMVKEKPYVYGSHFPRQTISTCLGSSQARRDSRRRGSSASTFQIVPKLPVQHGIDAGKWMLYGLWINEEKCQLWLDALAQYRRDSDDRRGC